jgi:hypothetical protein
MVGTRLERVVCVLPARVEVSPMTTRQKTRTTVNVEVLDSADIESELFLSVREMGVSCFPGPEDEFEPGTED